MKVDPYSHVPMGVFPKSWRESNLDGRQVVVELQLPSSWDHGVGMTSCLHLTQLVLHPLQEVYPAHVQM